MVCRWFYPCLHRNTLFSQMWVYCDRTLFLPDREWQRGSQGGVFLQTAGHLQHAHCPGRQACPWVRAARKRCVILIREKPGAVGSLRKKQGVKSIREVQEGDGVLTGAAQGCVKRAVQEKPKATKHTQSVLRRLSLAQCYNSDVYCICINKIFL